MRLASTGGRATTALRAHGEALTCNGHTAPVLMT
jgi:hypothetical protein